MQQDGLGAQFEQLQGVQSRHGALDDLVSRLSTYDWTYLRDKLNARSFQFDIISGLPVELVTLIFVHLDAMAIYRLRTVSKSWNQILRSTDIQKTILSQWYGVPVMDDTAIAQKAEQLYRLQTGNPLDTVIAQVGHFSYGFLVNDVITWATDSRPRALHLLKLSTGEYRQACGAAREEIRSVSASDRLLAFVTYSNTCYVEDFVTRERKSFRLPNHMFERLACRGSIVACGGLTDRSMELYVWDFDAQRGITIELALGQMPELINDAFFMLPTSCGKAVMLFGTDHGGMGTRVYCCMISTAGIMIKEHFRCYPESYTSFIRDIQPLDGKGRYALRLVKVDSAAHERVSVVLEFDELQFAFIEHNFPSGRGQCFEDDFSRWKDVYYKAGRYQDDGMLVCLGTKAQPVHKPLPSGSLENGRFPTTGSTYQGQVFINDSYIVQFGENQWIKIYNFAKDFRLPEATIRGHLESLYHSER